MTFFFTKKIRNFAIIAHIDHGKSTLADRFLELTNLKKRNKQVERILDSLSLEQKKGITIKLNAVQLYYPPENPTPYIFNLIDTPGHVDFMYEVSRSLVACEGVLLLVDATKGIQAQSLAYYQIAKNLNLKILPVINKIELPSAQLTTTKNQLIELLSCQESDIALISAKTGKNVELLLKKIIDEIPAPLETEKKELKILVFDLLYNRYHGVIVYIRILEGELKNKQKIKLASNQKTYQVDRLGVKIPEEILKDKLITGEIGWFTANIRDMKEIKVGEIIIDATSLSLPVANYQVLKPNIYSNLYPTNTAEFNEFKKALEELQLQDSTLILSPIDSNILGPGLRGGFLGLLHLEVIQGRLKEEHDLDLIITPPTINYLLTLTNGEKTELANPTKMPPWSTIKSIEELFISLIVITPQEYVGKIMELCQTKRGIYQSQEWKTNNWYQIVYQLPFAEFIYDFHDRLKSLSHGYASFEYEFIGYQPSRIVKVDILLNNQLVEDLSFLIHQTFAYERAKKLCESLKETLNPQNFAIPIQACIGGKIIARETLPALRKNVTGKCYGGDITRKRKLWEKQREGKKKMQKIGKVTISGNLLRNILGTKK